MTIRRKPAFIQVIILWVLFFATSAPAAFLVTDCTDEVTTGVPQIECEALEAFWDSTNGSSWTSKFQWDSNSPINSWSGVLVSGGHVTLLSMAANNVSGSLPAELGNLSELTEIKLNQNSIGGSIPASLGNLSKLTKLTLDLNQFSGSIPMELGNLSALESFSASQNQLSGTIPASFGNLLNLNYLILFSNQLSGSIPPSLGNLSSLISLQLQTNALSGPIPIELGNLSALLQLALGQNQLTGSIPVEFQNLNNLAHLQLNKNHLSGDIPDLSGNVALNSFNFTENKFVFEDFEPEHLAYQAKMGGGYQYIAQDFVDSARVINVTPGQMLVITPELAENPSGNDQYQWHKNGTTIPGPEGTQRVFSKVATVADAGDYWYRVTNSVVTSLILPSHGLNTAPDAIVVNVNGTPAPDYTVGGTISGLNGMLTLQNNGGDDLQINTNGSYSFATPLADAASYSVAVSSQPPGQICSVSNATGVISAANVTDVSINCVDDVIPPSGGMPAKPIPSTSLRWLILLSLLIGIAGVRRQRL